MHLRPRLYLSCLLVAALGVSPAVAAQGPEPMPPITPNQLARAETFRADFVQLVDLRQDLANAANDEARQQRLAEAKRIMSTVPAEQIARFQRHATLSLRPLIRANVKLRNLMAERTRAAAALPEPKTPGFPDRPAILADCNNIAHDSAFTFGALIAVQVADGLLAALGRVCDEVVVVLGEGGNTSLVCLPLEIALSAAKIPFELADFCGGEEDSSFLEGSFDRLGHIH